jgi:hypothetical protein
LPAKTLAARKTPEHSRGFHELVKWRTGSEGRISYLKRGFGHAFESGSDAARLAQVAGAGPFADPPGSFVPVVVRIHGQILD